MNLQWFFKFRLKLHFYVGSVIGSALTSSVQNEIDTCLMDCNIILERNIWCREDPNDLDVVVLGEKSAQQTFLAAAVFSKTQQPPFRSHGVNAPLLWLLALPCQIGQSLNGFDSSHVMMATNVLDGLQHLCSPWWTYGLWRVCYFYGSIIRVYTYTQHHCHCGPVIFFHPFVIEFWV